MRAFQRQESKGKSPAKGLHWDAVRHTPVILLLLLLIHAHQATAQEVRPFAVTGYSGYTQLMLRGIQESQGSRQFSTTSETLQFREGVRLDMNGYIYLPQLARLHLGGLIEYVEYLRSGSQEEGGPGSRLPWTGDFGVSILEDHPVRLDLHGNRTQTDVDQPFARDYLLDSTSIGGTLSLRKGPLPTELSVSRNTARGSGVGADINETTDDVLLRSDYQFNQRSSGSIEYHLTDTTEQWLNKNFLTQQLSLNNATLFGASDNIRLNSNLRLYEQKSTLDLLTLSLYERMDWHHSDRLSSYYHLLFDMLGGASQSSDRIEVGAGLHHKLFNSLDTNVEAYLRREDADYGTITTYGASDTENYTKELGDWGRLGLSLRGFGEMVDNSISKSTGTAEREAHNVNLGTLVELNHREVLPETIRVTDVRGIRVYQISMDYTLVTIGDVVRILPNASGHIPDNSTILVDYSYKLPGNGEVLTAGILSDSRLYLGKWLTLYGRLERSRQDQVTGVSLTRLESLFRQVIGTMVNWRWFTVGAEYENRESVYSPSETMSEWVSVDLPHWHQWQAQVSATYRDSTLGDTGRAFSALDLHLLLANQITQRSRLSVEGDYRIQTWDKADSVNDLDGLGVRVNYGWRYQKLSVDLIARLSKMTQHGRDEDRNRVEIRVRREF